MPEIVGRLRTPRLSAAPSSPVVGEMYYDTGTNILYWWNGTTWISASGSGATLDLKYDGSWVAGTYNDGDIVIGADGITYLCVVNGTTTAPVPWATGIPPSAPSYDVTLPANPTNGQEAILVDSTTNPTYQWRFRYNTNNTTSFKWEFIGGSPWSTFNSGGSGQQISLAASTAQRITITNELTLPRSGIYYARFGGYLTTAAFTVNCILDVCFYRTTATNIFSSATFRANSGSIASSVSSVYPVGTLGWTAGDLVGISLRSDVAQSVIVIRPFLEITPVRVA